MITCEQGKFKGIGNGITLIGEWMTITEELIRHGVLKEYKAFMLMNECFKTAGMSDAEKVDYFDQKLEAFREMLEEGNKEKSEVSN